MLKINEEMFFYKEENGEFDYEKQLNKLNSLLLIHPELIMSNMYMKATSLRIFHSLIKYYPNKINLPVSVYMPFYDSNELKKGSLKLLGVSSIKNVLITTPALLSDERILSVGFNSMYHMLLITKDEEFNKNSLITYYELNRINTNPSEELIKVIQNQV